MSRPITDMSWSDIVAADFTIENDNRYLQDAIDHLRKEKDRLYTINRSQQMGFNTQKQMHKNNPIQLKMVDNQIQFSEQVLRGSLNKMDNKIRDLERTLDEKKARDIETVQHDVENLKEDVSGLAGQINILKKEAAERKKTIDDEMNKIRAQSADQSSWNEDVYSKLYELQANSSLLMAEYDEKQKQLREKQYIDSDANTSAFYSKIFSKMNEVFVASKAVQSGMVDRSKYSNGDKAVGYISLVGSLIPLPAAATILGYVAQGVQYLSDKRESERINNITSNALGFSEMDEICDWISRGLCFAYEEQIRALKTAAAEAFAECCVAYILEFLAKKEEDRSPHIDPSVDTTIVHASTDADGNPIGEVSSGVIPSVTHDSASSFSPQEQLVSDLLVYMSKRRGVRNGSYMMSNVKLEARIPGIEWTDWGIIKQTGLRTASGVIYHAAPLKPAVKKQGWNYDHRKPGPSPSPAPRSSESSLVGSAPAAEPSPPIPSPPVMKKSPSIGARLFRWKEPKEVAKAAQEAVKSVTDLKEKAADVALVLSFKAAGQLDNLLAADETCRPEFYGYRLGTAREAVLLNMIVVGARAPSKVVPLNSDQLARDPNAASRFWAGK